LTIDLILEKVLIGPGPRLLATPIQLGI